jgi:hypothetical protein
MEDQIINIMINGIPNLDQWLLEFIRLNFITLGIILGILKIIAIETPCATDNKIIELLLAFLPKKKQNK